MYAVLEDEFADGRNSQKKWNTFVKEEKQKLTRTLLAAVSGRWCFLVTNSLIQVYVLCVPLLVLSFHTIAFLVAVVVAVLFVV